jgi:hypothetical protein
MQGDAFYEAERLWLLKEAEDRNRKMEEKKKKEGEEFSLEIFNWRVKKTIEEPKQTIEEPEQTIEGEPKKTIEGKPKKTNEEPKKTIEGKPKKTIEKLDYQGSYRVLPAKVLLEIDC